MPPERIGGFEHHFKIDHCIADPVMNIPGKALSFLDSRPLPDFNGIILKIKIGIEKISQRIIQVGQCLLLQAGLDDIMPECEADQLKKRDNNKHQQDIKRFWRNDHPIPGRYRMET